MAPRNSFAMQSAPVGRQCQPYLKRSELECHDIVCLAIGDATIRQAGSVPIGA